MSEESQAEQMSDLFAESPIGNVAPQDWRKYIEYITEEKSIPEDLKKLFWAFSDKENVLSNLRQEDINRIMNNLEIAYNFEVMKIPPYVYSFNMEQQFWQFKSKLLLKLKRSELGFERRTQATQIKEISTQQSGQQARGGITGFMSRIFGR